MQAVDAVAGQLLRRADLVRGRQHRPKPMQRPHPPLWFGANAEAAVRRAVRYADGWTGRAAARGTSSRTASNW